MNVAKKRFTSRRRRSIQSLILSDTRYRAKRKRISCTLTKEDVQRIFRQAGGQCQLTGIEFDRDWRGAGNKYRFKPYRPSLDRIDAREGYTPDNVRLVISAMNTALSEYGEEVFDEIARAYLERKGCTIRNR